VRQGGPEFEIAAPRVVRRDPRSVLARCRLQIAQAMMMQTAARTQVRESEALVRDAKSMMLRTARRRPPRPPL
jgi:hypothetical protein